MTLARSFACEGGAKRKGDGEIFFSKMEEEQHVFMLMGVCQWRVKN